MIRLLRRCYLALPVLWAGYSGKHLGVPWTNRRRPMLRRWQNAPNESDIEDLGVFEYLDDEAPHFVAALPPPPPRPVHDPVLAARLRLELPMLWGWLFLTCFFTDAGPWLLWG